jgi:hypothetical protein
VTSGRATCAAALLVLSCGPEDEVARGSGHVVTELRVAASVGNVRSVDAYVLAGRTIDGHPLDCGALAKASPATRPDLLVRAHRLLPLADAKLPGLGAEGGLVLAVDAYASEDGTGARTGYGCTDGIVIRAEATTAVTLVIGGLP